MRQELVRRQMNMARDSRPIMHINNDSQLDRYERSINMSNQTQRFAMGIIAIIIMGFFVFSCSAGMTIAGGDVSRDINIFSHNTTISMAAPTAATSDSDTLHGILIGLLVSVGAFCSLALVVSMSATRHW